MKNKKLTEKEVIRIFHLNEVSREQYEKQHYDFKFIAWNMNGIICLNESTREVLNDPAKCTYSVDEVRMEMNLKFRIEDWQIEKLEGENGIELIALIADINDNVKIFIDAMKALGWSFRIADKMGGPYSSMVVLRFDPMYQDDVYNEAVKNFSWLIHWSPTYHHESIVKNGLQPKTENKGGEYPDRIYFVGTHGLDENALIEFGRQIYKANTDNRNNGIYDLYGIKPEDMRGNLPLYYDPYLKGGFYTDVTVPYKNMKHLYRYDFKNNVYIPLNV